METLRKHWLSTSLTIALLGSVSAFPALAAPIYSSEANGTELNDIDTGSGENSYYFDMGSSSGKDSGPRTGGTFGVGGGINGAGGGGGFGGGGFRSASFSSGPSSFSSGPGFQSFVPKNDNTGNPYPTENCIGPCPLQTGPTETNLNGDSSVDPIPEPATLAILGAGLMGLGLVRRRRK